MVVDLSYARQRVVELLMGDSCIIDRSDLGPQDWVMDDQTLELTVPDNSSAQIYDGICQIVSGASGVALPAGLGLEANMNVFTVRLPWDEGNDVEIGDYVTITECRDATLEGAHLRVSHVARTSMGIDRKLICSALESNRDR